MANSWHAPRPVSRPEQRLGTITCSNRGELLAESVAGAFRQAKEKPANRMAQNKKKSHTPGLDLIPLDSSLKSKAHSPSSFVWGRSVGGRWGVGVGSVVQTASDATNRARASHITTPTAFFLLPLK